MTTAARASGFTPVGASATTRRADHRERLHVRHGEGKRHSGGDRSPESLDKGRSRAASNRTVTEFAANAHLHRWGTGLGENEHGTLAQSAARSAASSA